MDVIYPQSHIAASSTASTSDQQSTSTMAVDMMTRGFESHLSQSIDKISAVLDEILQKQRELLDKVHTDNQHLNQNEAVRNVHLTMLHTQQYYKKLLKIQKDMLDLHKKRAKLKERAQRITEHVYQNQLDHQKQIASECQKAESIIAKPAQTVSHSGRSASPQMDALPSTMTATPPSKGKSKSVGSGKNDAQRSTKAKTPKPTAKEKPTHSGANPVGNNSHAAKFSNTITKVDNSRSSK